MTLPELHASTGLTPVRAHISTVPYWSSFGTRRTTPVSDSRREMHCGPLAAETVPGGLDRLAVLFDQLDPGIDMSLEPAGR